MSRKSKGINAERDLVHKLWAKGFASVRVAGSGSMRYPSADILASNKVRRLAIECKTAKESAKYLAEQDIVQLKEFASFFGAEPWIAVKFDREDWLFLSLDDLQKTKNNYVITLETAKNKGLILDELLEK